MAGTALDADGKPAPRWLYRPPRWLYRPPGGGYRRHGWVQLCFGSVCWDLDAFWHTVYSLFEHPLVIKGLPGAHPPPTSPSASSPVSAAPGAGSAAASASSAPPGPGGRPWPSGCGMGTASAPATAPNPTLNPLGKALLEVRELPDEAAEDVSCVVPMGHTRKGGGCRHSCSSRHREHGAARGAPTSGPLRSSAGHPRAPVG